MIFPSLIEFVQHYSSNSLRDHNPMLDTCLREPVHLRAPDPPPRLPKPSPSASAVTS